MTATSDSTPGSAGAGPVNLAHWVRERASGTPDAVALRQGGTTLTYAQLDVASAAFAGRLRALGVGPGDRVALVAPNVLAFPVAYYAILRLGAVVVPMNPLLKAGEVAYTLRDCEARAAVVFSMFADEVGAAGAETGTEVVVVAPGELEAAPPPDGAAGAGTDSGPDLEVVERAPQDVAVILYTSGTTGRPKGAELSFANLRSNVLACVETLFGNGPEDVLFGGLPLFHSFGQTCALNTAVAGGSCLTLLPRFDPREALEVVARDQVTVFLGVPTMYMALLGVPDRDAYDTSTVRLGVSGGSSLPVEVLHGVEEAFGLKVLEGYGLSETSPVASFNHPDRPSKAGSVGVPIRGVEMALARPPQEDGAGEEDGPGADVELLDPADTDAVGEVVVRGENIMLGYRGDPEATRAAVRDGWFHTGDLARRDADGYYFIVDRVKDLIIRNGFNVYPREVEEVLYAHPAVAEAAVVGVPDPAHGEEVGALVQLKEGAQVGEDELRDFVAQRIAAFKYPRVIRFGAVPKGPTGKILKREIHLER